MTESTLDGVINSLGKTYPHLLSVGVSMDAIALMTKNQAAKLAEVLQRSGVQELSVLRDIPRIVVSLPVFDTLVQVNTLTKLDLSLVGGTEVCSNVHVNWLAGRAAVAKRPTNFVVLTSFLCNQKPTAGIPSTGVSGRADAAYVAARVHHRPNSLESAAVGRRARTQPAGAAPR